MKLRVGIVCWIALLAPPAQAALSAEQQAAHVLNRLAYGPRPGDIARVVEMGIPRYIASQLDPSAIDYPPELASRLLAQDALRRAPPDEEAGARQRRRQQLEAADLEVARARLLRAIDSPRQLEEMLVEFWFNHFNVFSGKGDTRALIASYERDAIRPHVLGPFRTLLGATAKHPAMLIYLDNAVSTAPLAAGPRRKARGLNENYARELMELHTLGVDGGYTQHDVTELARMLTGWSFDQKALIASNQTFRFDPRRHDDGPKRWLGMTVLAQGQDEGEAALDFLAVHPATARRISFKLAQYFVHDRPAPALVERMARVWQDSGGDVRSVLRTLFGSAEFMAPDVVGAKFKTPYGFVVSAARASGTAVTDIAPLLGAMRQLGMPLYGCPTPDGYRNTEAAWLNPDAMSRRIAFAARLAGGVDPQRLAAALGPAISPRTATLVTSHPQGMRAAMLLGSPDFMQR